MKSERRPPKLPTAESLQASALFYLSRYAASEASLRRVLQNKIRRATIQNSEFAHDEQRLSDLRSVIDAIISKHKKSGVVNDPSFAEMKVRSLRRAGRSRRYIEQALRQNKGIDPDTIKTALAAYDDDDTAGDAEMTAADLFARRRKFGKYRTRAVDEKTMNRELSAFARAGFSHEVAGRVLGDKIKSRSAKAG